MKYQKVIQKPYCCVGACLEMILNRNHIANDGQVVIACQLGLTVPEEYRDEYPNAIIGEKPDAGYGTQIQKRKFSINNFFKINNIDLKEKYYFITDVTVAKKFLLDNNKYDIMICCHCATLYDNLYEDWGHMVLFENIYNNNVTILDPSDNKCYENISLERLLKSKIEHGQSNGAGFYLIK